MLARPSPLKAQSIDGKRIMSCHPQLRHAGLDAHFFRHPTAGEDGDDANVVAANVQRVRRQARLLADLDWHTSARLVCRDAVSRLADVRIRALVIVQALPKQHTHSTIGLIHRHAVAERAVVDAHEVVRGR